MSKLLLFLLPLTFTCLSLLVQYLWLVRCAILWATLFGVGRFYVTRNLFEVLNQVVVLVRRELAFLRDVENLLFGQAERNILRLQVSVDHFANAVQVVQA